MCVCYNIDAHIYLLAVYDLVFTYASVMLKFID